MTWGHKSCKDNCYKFFHTNKYIWEHNETDYTRIRNVWSFYDCKEYCKNHTNCLFFDWNVASSKYKYFFQKIIKKNLINSYLHFLALQRLPKNQDCILFNKAGQYQRNNWHVSGTKYCLHECKFGSKFLPNLPNIIQFYYSTKILLSNRKTIQYIR